MMEMKEVLSNYNREAEGILTLLVFQEMRYELLFLVCSCLLCLRNGGKTT